MDSSAQDRNLPASPRKLQRAREEGQVARSQDLGHLCVLGGGALVLLLFSGYIYQELRLALSRQLTFDASAVLQTGAMLERLQSMVQVGLWICVMFAVLVNAVAIVGALAAGGWVFSFKPLMPQWSRLNPLQGLKAMFTQRRLAETLKMTCVAGLVLLLGAAFMQATLPTLASWLMQPSMGALKHMLGWLLSGMGLLLLLILLVALVDVPLQGFLHRAELKMSRQELRDEHKESDGNPQIKHKLRQRQRELAQGQSVRAVPQADFIVMNPTHYAVAIKYDEQTMRAPRVISKGADLLALRIRDLAKAHEIPVLSAPALARALYAHAELNQDIPVSLYAAVAQVLAYIYRLRAALRGAGPMPELPPQPQLPPGLDPLQGRQPASRLSEGDNF